MIIGTLAAILPWLALLACPVMMFWMMRMGGQCHTQAKDGSQPDVSNNDTGAKVDDEIQQLRDRLARLEATRHESTSRAEVGT